MQTRASVYSIEQSPWTVTGHIHRAVLLHRERRLWRCLCWIMTATWWLWWKLWFHWGLLCFTCVWGDGKRPGLRVRMCGWWNVGCVLKFFDQVYLWFLVLDFSFVFIISVVFTHDVLTSGMYDIIFFKGN